VTTARTDAQGSLDVAVICEAVEHFPDAVTLSRAVLDASGRATDMVMEYMNAAARARQADAASAIGRDCGELWAQAAERGAFAACLEVLDSGIEASGQLWWSEDPPYRGTFNFRAIRIGEDHLLLVLRDNTRNVRRLEEDRARFRATFHGAPVGMALVDRKGRLTDANLRLADLIGVPASKLDGVALTDLIDPVERAEVATHLAALAEGRIDHIEEDRCLRVGPKEPTWVHMALALVRDVDGAPLHSVAHVIDVSRAKQAEAQLSRAATHDPLTGLPNRFKLLEHLELAIDRFESAGPRSCLLVIDVDHFKVVNDSLGHATGDELLQTVAGRLEAAVPRGQLVARLGGDEFAVVCELGRMDRHAKGTELLCRRIASSLSSPCKVSGRSVVVQASIGVAFVEGGSSAAELLRDADAALYEAKRKGRNTFAVFNDSLRARALDRMETESRMRAGLASDEFVPFYQPVVDLSSGAVIGLEALARWRRQGTFLTPATFLPVAEEAGLLVALSEQIVSRATADMSQWSVGRSGWSRPLPWLSVNASPTQLQQPEFSNWLAGVLSARSLAGDRLVVEITEDSLLTGDPASWRTLSKLRELGCRIAIDDFGTGYSSLGYLRQLPVDILKLDRVFVSGAAHEAKDRALLKTFVDLGDALGLTVVAEGVETAEQLQMLRDCGCALAQGYGLGRPAPAESIEGLLAGAPLQLLAQGSPPVLAGTRASRPGITVCPAG
jgi:diguanylate cyclase (GGDEF)-like protein/PAS domain S-box-containing protein